MVCVDLVQNAAARSVIDLVDGIPQLMAAIKDTQGRYTYVNSGFAARLGRDPREIVGLTVTELFADELAGSYSEQDELVLTTGRPLQHHLELIVRADSTLGWYVTSKTALRTDSGEIVGIAVVSIDLQSQVNSAHAGLAAAINAIRQDIHVPWRVADLASIAGLSSPQFERLCRRTLGIPPQQLLQRLRIEHAVSLMTRTSMSIGDIAVECGFYDQSSFTRQFRKVLGLTPGAYRRTT